MCFSFVTSYFIIDSGRRGGGTLTDSLPTTFLDVTSTCCLVCFVSLSCWTSVEILLIFFQISRAHFPYVWNRRKWDGDWNEIGNDVPLGIRFGGG